MVTTSGLYFAVIKYSRKWNRLRNVIYIQACGVHEKYHANANEPANTMPRRKEKRATMCA
jgi:hypothetical protein